MSSYAELTLGPLVLAMTRNGTDPNLMWMFRESEKYVEQLDRHNPERLGKYVTEEAIDDFDASNQLSYVVYRASASEIKDRLNLKGYTREIAELGFMEGLRNEIDDRKWRQGLFPSPAWLQNESLDVLNSLAIQDWQSALKRICEENLTKENISTLPSNDPELPLLRYMLRDSSECYGFPGENGHQFWLFVRLAIEIVPPDAPVEYDLTDIAQGGWVDENSDLITEAEGLLHADLQLAEKVIVLTEGETDRRVLNHSLKLLYPHLWDYFHFFEFTPKKGGRIGGGIGELANLVRALASANVRHRILALFDNDTAAKSSLCTINKEDLPSNIAVYTYPDIPTARSYPTLGPSGMVQMDVNGKAGSLELYLGIDVLLDPDRNLYPVQWGGHYPKLNAYQGKVSNKNQILKNFERKLRQCEMHPEKIAAYDWDGIQAILNVMFTAFHEHDAETILGSYISD